MNSGQLQIMIAAHRGAQKAANDQAETYGYMSSPIRKRQEALQSMADCGFSQFLIDKYGCVKPISHGTQSCEETGESWTHWAVFDRAEVEAYLKFLGEDESDCVVVKHGEPCPNADCGCSVSYSRDYGYTRCPECGEMYDPRPNDNLLSKCEAALGGASYSGPGRKFNEESYARITKRGTRILVTQRGGWDV